MVRFLLLLLASQAFLTTTAAAQDALHYFQRISVFPRTAAICDLYDYRQDQFLAVGREFRDQVREQNQCLRLKNDESCEHYDTSIDILRTQLASITKQIRRFEEIPLYERQFGDRRFFHPMPDNLRFYLGRYSDVSGRIIKSNYSISGTNAPVCTSEELNFLTSDESPLTTHISCHFIELNSTMEYGVSFYSLEGNSGEICQSLRESESRSIATVASTYSPYGENAPLSRNVTVNLDFVIGSGTLGSWLDIGDNYVFFRTALQRITLEGTTVFSRTELETLLGRDDVTNDYVNDTNDCVRKLLHALSVDQNSRVAALIQEYVFAAGVVSYDSYEAYWQYFSGDSSWKIGVGNDGRLLSIQCETV